MLYHIHSNRKLTLAIVFVILFSTSTSGAASDTQLTWPYSTQINITNISLICETEDAQEYLMAVFNEFCPSDSDLESDACEARPFIPIGERGYLSKINHKTLQFRARLNWDSNTIQLRTYQGPTDSSDLMMEIQKIGQRIDSKCLVGRDKTTTVTKYNPPSMLFYFLFGGLVLIGIALLLKTIKLMSNAR